jgi:uncharacterized protein
VGRLSHPRDSYVHPGSTLGNVLDTPLPEIATDVARRRFLAHRHPMPDECTRSEWLAVGKSGCPRNRAADEDGERPDSFCASNKCFFAHADERLRHVAQKVRNKQNYLVELERAPRRVLRTRRNDRCPCGSGKKHKQCCGCPRDARSFLFAPPEAPQAGAPRKPPVVARPTLARGARGEGRVGVRA